MEERLLERFHQVEADYKNGVVQAKNLHNKQKAIFLDQPVIARGEVTWDELHEIHQKSSCSNVLIM